MILVIDPAVDFGKLTAQALQQINLQAVVATTAQEAILAVDNAKPKLIILELAMAEHNGLEFLYELRSHADLLHVPVIIYSHIAAEELGLSKSQQSRLGIAAHFYKPRTNLKTLLDFAHELTNSKAHAAA